MTSRMAITVIIIITICHLEPLYNYKLLHISFYILMPYSVPY